MLEEKDYISHLPDSIIHHILSFLPSTKEAIRTGILSKMWKNQWTHVPVLVFKFCKLDEPCKSFSMTIIKNILSLHRCSRIEKFECFFNNDFEEIQLSSVIGFANKRNVEELILRNRGYNGSLPKLLFKNASPVRLRLYDFQFEPNERVKWECLKILKLERCQLSNQGIKNALSGSPVLETLEIIKCYWDDDPIIASRSLQKVFLCNIEFEFTIAEIVCPNLWKLKCFDCMLCDQVIQDLSSSSPILESLELERCFLSCLKQPGISSESLKRLVLDCISVYNVHDGNKMLLSEIVCPKLERLEFSGNLDFLSCVVLNFPSLDSAYLDFWPSMGRFDNLVHQLKHAKELTICHETLKVLSNTKMARRSSPFLAKSLVLEIFYFDDQHKGIAWALQNFQVLEKLEVKIIGHYGKSMGPFETILRYASSYFNFNGSYWDSRKSGFGCLASHLKFVKVIGFSKKNGQCKLALEFVEFLLKNGRVLEKVVVTPKHCDKDFRSEVYQKLVSLEKCNKHADVELIRDMGSVVRFLHFG